MPLYALDSISQQEDNGSGDSEVELPTPRRHCSHSPEGSSDINCNVTAAAGTINEYSLKSKQNGG